jgi:hypothetical protein
MRALAALLLCSACTASVDSTADAPPVDDTVCKANLEAELDRECMTPADCVVVESADCCGPVMLGIDAATQSQFDAIEQAYVSCLACAPMGCQHAPQDEDGRVAQTGQSIVADCIVNRCVATVK